MIEASVIIPTINRASILKRTLESVFEQNYLPKEIIIIDASDTLSNLQHLIVPDGLNLKHIEAETKGAAAQRNQGIKLSSQPFIFFMDDDILLEAQCIERIWNCMMSDEKIGGVNAMITNQKYQNPGSVSRLMYYLMSGQTLKTYAGKCIGPAWNLLPEDREELPLCCKVEWLNTTCTLYRKTALPDPVFDSFFSGYSLMEDLTLSLIVGQNWNLMNARTARIFHDSQPGAHKNRLFELERMELRNRFYVMTHILQRTTPKDYLRLWVFEMYKLLLLLRSIKLWFKIPEVLLAKFVALIQIIGSKPAN